VTTSEKCRKCYRSLVECATCRGKGKVWGTFGDCTECSGTGYRCPEHDRHWT